MKRVFAFGIILSLLLSISGTLLRPLRLSVGLRPPSAYADPSDWPMFRHDPAHTGYNPDETQLKPPLRLKWTFQAGHNVNSSPAVVNGVVYVGSDDEKVYALDAATGTVKWSYQTAGWVESSPAVADGVVYVGSRDGKVYALDATAGTLRWSLQTGSYIISSPTVVDGVVYIGSEDWQLRALDANTGARRWSTLTGYGVSSSPAVVNGVVYVGSEDSKVYAIAYVDANRTFQPAKWSYQTGSVIGNSSPAVAGGVVYVGSYDGKLYALDAAAGTLKWSYQTGNRVQSSPAVVSGVVYVGSMDGKLYALNAATGSLVWSFESAGAIFTSPAVANGIVYLGTQYPDAKLYALDAGTGAVKWSYYVGNMSSSPTVANGMVYIGTGGGKLYAFGPGGWLPKADMITGRAWGATAVVNNVIYTLAGHEGSLYGRKHEAYDPATDSWSSKAVFPRSDGRYNLAAVALGGKVYTIGGTNIWGNYNTDTVDRYDPATNSWTTDVAIYPKATSGTACVEYQGKAYCFGGASYAGTLYNDTYEFSGTAFTARAAMPTARQYAFAAVVGSKIYVVGGAAAGGDSGKNEIYDPASDSWTSGADLPLAASQLAGGVLEGKVYVVTAQGTVYEYDPSSNGWTNKGTIGTTPREGAFEAAVNGRLYILGGRQPTGNVFLKSVEEGTGWEVAPTPTPTPTPMPPGVTPAPPTPTFTPAPPTPTFTPAPPTPTFTPAPPTPTFTVTPIPVNPVLLGVEPRYQGTFLKGVPVLNEYTARVDWKGAKRVVLDPGHGWVDSRGGEGLYGLVERKAVLEIAQLAQKELQRRQPTWQVFLSRTGEMAITLSQGVAKVNNMKPDAVVSIHTNGTGGTGTEACYTVGKDTDGHSMALADYLTKAIAGRVFQDLKKIRGIFPENDLYRCARKAQTGWDKLYIHDFDAPSALVELAFHDNDKDAILLRDRKDDFAKAVADGVLNYFGIADYQPARYMRFTLNGVTTVEAARDSYAKHTYDMGRDLRASPTGGDNLLRVVATSAGQESTPYELRPAAVLIPTYLGSTGWTAEPIGNAIRYKKGGSIWFSEFSALTTVGNKFPFLKGSLGIQSLAGLEAQTTLSSLGPGEAKASLSSKLAFAGQELSGKLTGKGDLYLGKVKGVELRAFDVNAKLGYKITKTQSLIVVIPELDKGRNLPVIGPVIGKVIDIAKVEGSLEIGGQAGLRLDVSADGKVYVGENRVGLNTGAKLALAFDVYIASVTFYGGGKGEVLIIVPKAGNVEVQPTLSLFAGVEIRVLWVKGKWEANWKWPSAAAQALGWQEEPEGSWTWGLVPRPPRPEDSSRLVSATPLTVFASDTLTQTRLYANEFVYADPSLAVSQGGKALMVWAHDDTSKQQIQGYDIFGSFYDGKSWSSPVALTNDTYPDLSPKVAWAGTQNAVAVWQRHKDPTLPVTSTITSELLAGQEVAFATFSAQTGEWSPGFFLTNNSYLDHSPKVASGRDGKVLAAWTANEANVLLGTSTNPDTVWYAFWDAATGWSFPAVALQGLAGLVDWDMAYDGLSGGLLAVVKDEDGDLSTTSDHELYIAQWTGAGFGSLQRLTNDSTADDRPRALYGPNGDLRLAWLKENTLMLWQPGAQPRSVRTDESVSLRDAKMAVDAEGHLVLLWASYSEAGSDILYSVYDPSQDTWGAGQALTNDQDLERSFQAAFAPNGELMVGYARTPMKVERKTLGVAETPVDVLVPEDFSHLYTLNQRLYRDLTLSDQDLSLSDLSPDAGDPIALTVNLKNLGNLPVSGVQLSVYDGDPDALGRLVRSMSISDMVLGGGVVTSTATINLTTPGRHELFVRAVAPTASETDTTNNQAKIVVDVGGPRSIYLPMVINQQSGGW